jgi:hypothetical protein
MMLETPFMGVAVAVAAGPGDKEAGAANYAAPAL